MFNDHFDSKIYLTVIQILKECIYHTTNLMKTGNLIQQVAPKTD